MTRRAVRAVALTDREELLGLVEEALPELGEGLAVLDRRLPAGRVVVDLVAVDDRGRLVLCLLGSGRDAGLILEGLEAYGWFRDNRALVGRLFPGARVDAEAPPRLFLFAPRFADDLRRAVRHLGPSAPGLVECRGVLLDGARALCVEVLEGDAEDPGREPEDPSRAGARRLVSYLERLDFREAFG